MATVLITGANRGLGLEFARQYAAAGFDVIGCCRAPGKAEALAKLGVRVEALDVASAESAAGLAKALHGTPIDILIANAGWYGPEAQDADACDFDGFLETFRINSLGPLRIAQALRENLIAGREKKLAVLTSKMGSISDSSGGYLAYRASKAALNMIAHGLARGWQRDGISVAILHPGWVKTDMGGPNAPLSPPESIKGMIARIAELTPATSGTFIDYAGKPIGW
jgi:NAD(P)-dependent dehydrogenase (short-subunit alcohol dehydrogenase family)